MAHELLRLLCLEYKVVDYPYFSCNLELWEAYLLCNNLQYCDRAVQESSRMIAFIIAQVNSRKKLKLSDITSFAWEEKSKDKIKKQPREKLSQEEINKRAKAFLNRTHGK